MRQRIYNPAHLDVEELRSTFVAREHELSELKRLLKRATYPRQHAILVGRRGMGKTTLGLRFCQEISSDPKLSVNWQPIVFFEESYGITNLADLWILTLDHLSDVTGQAKWSERASFHSEEGRNEDSIAAHAFSSLMEYCNESGKFLLLFVENIDEIFSQFSDKKRQLSKLREILISRPEILLLGTSTSMFPAIKDRRQPLYEFFQLFQLQPLSAEETFSFISRLSKALGDNSLQESVEKDPGRLQVIWRLTGGVPRWISFACRLLIESPFGSIREDVERLIDEQTPYFKSQIEALSPQLRKTFHIVAANWAPVLTKEVAAEMRVSSSHASALLSQLKDDGYVESVELPQSKRSGYQVTDRFYNIYYLSRFTRNQKRKLERYIEFAYQMFGPTGLEKIFRSTIERLRDIRTYDVEERDSLQYFAQLIVDEKRILNRQMLWQQALEVCVETHADSTEFIKLTPEVFEGATPELMSAIDLAVEDNKDNASSLIEIAGVLEKLDRLEMSEDLLVKAVRLDTKNQTALHQLGVVRAKLNRWGDAEEAFSQLAQLIPTDVHITIHLAETIAKQGREESAIGLLEGIEVPGKIGVTDQLFMCHVLVLSGEDARAKMLARQICDRDDLSIENLSKLGSIFDSLGEYPSVEGILKRILAEDCHYQYIWMNLSYISSVLDKPKELAELTDQYLDQCSEEPEFWYAKALAAFRIDHQEEALVAFREAVELGGDFGFLWFYYGETLRRTGDLQGALAAFDKAVEANPESVSALHQRGLVEEDLEAYKDAEQTFLRILEIDPESGHPWIHLGGIYQVQGKPRKSETAYKNAIAKDEDLSRAWSGLAELYSDRGEWKKALSAAQSAVAADPSDIVCWHYLIDIALDAGDEAEAEKAIDRAIELDPEDRQHVAICAIQLARIKGKEEEALRVLQDHSVGEDGSPAEVSILAGIYGKNGKWDLAGNVFDDWVSRNWDTWKVDGLTYFQDFVEDAVVAGHGLRIVDTLSRDGEEYLEPLIYAIREHLGEKKHRLPLEIRESVDELKSRFVDVASNGAS